MEGVVCKLAQEPEKCPGDGDWSVYLFRFRAVPESKWETPHEPGATYVFWAQLRVTGPLLACGSWPRTPEESRKKYFFQLVQDELKKRPPPPSKEPKAEVVRLDLTSDHPLVLGPETQYEVTRIQLDEPFLIPPHDEPRPPIGFGKQA